MKVVLVSNLYGDTARGGAERIVQQEADSLAESGHQVTVVSLESCHPREGGDPEKENPSSILLPSTNLFHYLDLSKHAPLARLCWHLLDMTNARTARALISVIPSDPGPRAGGDPGSMQTLVVHTHNLMGLGFLIPATLRRRRIRHIHTVHDVQLLHPSGLLATATLSFAARAYATAMRALMGSPSVVIFPSKYLQTLHDAHGFFPRSKKIVLANPAPPVVPVRIRPSPRFFFAGQLESHKGVRVLVDAWRSATQASDSMKSAELVIAGAGSLEDELKGSAKDLSSIRFVGKLSADQVRAEMLRAAWTIVPSTVIENAPAVIAESLSAGTPVIASIIGGIPEFVQEGSTGTLVVPGDVDALADAMKKAATMDDWETYSEACRAFAMTREMDAHLKTLESLYRA